MPDSSGCAIYEKKTISIVDRNFNLRIQKEAEMRSTDRLAICIPLYDRETLNRNPCKDLNSSSKIKKVDTAISNNAQECVHSENLTPCQNEPQRIFDSCYLNKIFSHVEKKEKGVSLLNELELHRPNIAPSICIRMMELRSRCAKSIKPEIESDRSRSLSHGKQPLPRTTRRGASVAAIKQRLFNNGLKIDLSVPTKAKKQNRYKEYMKNNTQNKDAISAKSLWFNDSTLLCLFRFLRPTELLLCSLVCKRWFHVLSKGSFMTKFCVSINFRDIFTDIKKDLDGASTPTTLNSAIENHLYAAYLRRITCIKISYMKDSHIQALTNAFVNSLNEHFPEYFDNAIFLIGETETLSQTLEPMENKSNSSFMSNTTLNARSIELLKKKTEEEEINIACDKDLSQFDRFEHSISLTRGFGNSNLINICETNKFMAANAKSLYGFSFDDKKLTRRKIGIVIPSSSSAPSQIPKYFARHFNHIILENCALSDKSLEKLTRTINTVTKLTIIGCNVFSEAACWSCLRPWMTHLTISDCLNFADDCLNAILNRLPNLQELSIQAYHLSDVGLACFAKNQQQFLRVLKIQHCLEVTNSGIIQMVSHLPNLHELSLAGCSKLSDDAIVMVCEYIKELKKIDVSLNTKVTDLGLECISCDLLRLELLNLDRCNSITEIGIRHVSMLPRLKILTLRWCCGLEDGALPYLLNLFTLRYLSIAGCKRFTTGGLEVLAYLRNLRHLEVTHSAAAHDDIKAYFQSHLPDCKIID